jgi:hypothetical protein
MTPEKCILQIRRSSPVGYESGCSIWLKVVPSHSNLNEFWRKCYGNKARGGVGDGDHGFSYLAFKRFV